MELIASTINNINGKVVVVIIEFVGRQQAMTRGGGSRKSLSRPCPSRGTAGAVVSPLKDFLSEESTVGSTFAGHRTRGIF